MSRSIVEYYSEHERHQCGYCKQLDTNCSHGMWAHLLTVTDYQNLIDRGWRRSGKYCYKPTMSKICCPMYTIRCAVLDFRLSKSQKKILKRVNKYLLSTSTNDSCENANGTSKDADNSVQTESYEADMLKVASEKSHLSINVDNVMASTDILESKNDNTKVIEKPNSNIQIANADCRMKTDSKCDKGKGADPSKQPCKKAKQLRLERKQQKLMAKGINPEEVSLKSKPKTQEKSIKDIINELPDDIKNKLQVKLVRTSPPSSEWEATSTETHKLYVKYQIAIHGDTAEKCSQKQFHNFLVSSPLQAQSNENGEEYGSFHQQYWLEGELIAVGVIDILPKCVSSVYFFYDPKYSHLTLGTYGALREVNFTQELRFKYPNLKFYYMGFYIHSCPKMRYKGNYNPSFLLCPETYNWFPIEECLPKLEASPYSRLNPDVDAIDTNDCTDKDLDDIPVLVGHTYMKYSLYKEHKAAKNPWKNRKRSSSYETHMLEYAKLVGKVCSKSLLLIKE